MITKHKFRIGDVVLVKGEVVIEEEDVQEAGCRYVQKRHIKRHELPEASRFRAVITGASTRCEGTRSNEAEYGYCFTTSKVVPVWLVRRSVCSREQAVFEEDLGLLVPVEQSPGQVKRLECPVPWKLSGAATTEYMRQEMRDIMADWPRDEKGHWKKTPLGHPFSVWLKAQTDDPEIGELAREAKEGSWSCYDLCALRDAISKHAMPQRLPVAVRAWHRWFEEKGEIKR